MKLNVRFIAKTNEELSKGLMHSSPLKVDECCLFVFKYLSDHSFWNKNVDFPICLFFMDENFEIRDIGYLAAHQEKPCRSKFPLTKYVLEGHADLPKEYNIHIGDFCLPESEKEIKIIIKKG